MADRPIGGDDTSSREIGRPRRPIGGGAPLFDPALAWNEDFPPDGKPLFAAVAGAVSNTPKVRLLVVPGVDGLLVDGRATEGRLFGLSLLPGRHIVRLPGSGALEVALDAGEGSTLVLPAQAGDEAVAWVESDARRGEPSTLLGVAVGQASPAYVVHGESVWKGEAGTASWEGLTGATPPVPAAAAPAPAPRARGAPTWLGWSGVAVLAGGTALAVASRAQGVEAAGEAAGAATWDAYEAASAEADSARGRYYAGIGVAAVGGLAAGAGFVW